MRGIGNECKEETFDSLNLDTSFLETSIDLKMQIWREKCLKSKDEDQKLKSQLKVLKSKMAILRILLPHEEMHVSEGIKEFEDREMLRIDQIILDCEKYEPSVFEQIYWHSQHMESGEIVYCGKYAFQHSEKIGFLPLSIAKVCFPAFIICEKVVAHVPFGTQIGPFSNEVFTFCKI